MGLLESFGAGISGAANTAKDVWAEQLKQQAMQQRESNLVRIQAMFAKEGRDSTHEFQSGETNKKIGADLTAAALKNTRDIKRDEQTDADARARMIIQKDYSLDLVKTTHGMKEGEKSDIEKKFQGLVKIGLTPDKAKELIEIAVGSKDTARETAIVLGIMKDWTDEDKNNPAKVEKAIALAKSVSDGLRGTSKPSTIADRAVARQKAEEEKTRKGRLIGDEMGLSRGGP